MSSTVVPGLHAAQLLAGGPSPLWYATRAGGTVALVLLTATVALGIGVAGRYVPRNATRFEINALHRNLSVLTLVFLALHIVTAIADTFVHLGWLVAVVPFTASYRPLWLGLGTVAFDLMLAVAISSAVRLRIGQQAWKRVHWAAYAAWPFAVFHGAGTGTDTRLPAQLLLYAGCLAMVLAAVWWRLYRIGPEGGTVRLWGGVTTIVLPVVLAVFLLAGPLRSGWAHRAGDATRPPATTTVSPGPTVSAQPTPATDDEGGSEQ